MSGNFKSRVATTGQHLLTICLLTAVFCSYPLAAVSEKNKFAVFDAQVSAPPELNGNGLKKVVHNYFESFDSGAITAVDVVKDQALHTAWVDLWWQIEQAIDAGHSLAELKDYGFTPTGDGGYSIDLERFPKWDSLNGRLSAYFASGLEHSVATLKEADFRDSDIAILRTYLADHPYPLGTPLASTSSLTKSFVVQIAQRATPAQHIATAELMALRYQARRYREETYRVWTVNLLQSLDPKRQKILVNKLMNRPGGLKTIWASSDGLEADLQQMEGYLLSDPFGQLEAPEVRP